MLDDKGQVYTYDTHRDGTSLNPVAYTLRNEEKPVSVAMGAEGFILFDNGKIWSLKSTRFDSSI